MTRWVAAGLVLLLTGCVTVPVSGPADERVVAALKEIPREGAWERTQCWTGLRVVVNADRTPTMSIWVCILYVNPLVLDWPHDLIRAGIAHELGHIINNDFSMLRSHVPRIEKERQADATAVRLLSRINLDACLALPRLLGGLAGKQGSSAHSRHQAPDERALETLTLCHQIASRSAR